MKINTSWSDKPSHICHSQPYLLILSTAYGPLMLSAARALYIVFHKKSNRYLIAHNFSICWPIFIFFTLGHSSDSVMNWLLKIPSQLEYVATLPCETLVFKNWCKISLVNISCSLSVISLYTGLLYLQASEAVWFYTLRYHIIILIYSAGSYLFRELCLPWHSVHHSLLPVQKCNNLRDLCELPDFCPLLFTAESDSVRILKIGQHLPK